MCLKRRSVIVLLILVLLCAICVESKAKKWRAQIKKKSHSPKISASYRIVAPKRKFIHKHKSVPHKRQMNYNHPLPSSWPTHTVPPPTYYLASNYPRYRSYITTPTRSTTTLRKLDPFISPTFSFGTPLRRSDEFDASTSALITTPLMDMIPFNADFSDGYFDPALQTNREFVQPEISLGGWTPIDYKSFMADADFSLLNDQMGMARQLDGDGLMLGNPIETYLV
ncbi:uncharacterized protein [Eurosta solidaginis]|uniref:uncharacterized protein n=1 Tax=Eurosta solidaginis TaxID=178769 RepID=UPI0035310FE7